MSFEDARRVADTVLYEGLILYPYRASSRKNRFRFQFGVLAPQSFTTAGGSEPSSMTVEVPYEGDDDVAITGKLRFLQLRRRTVERWDGERFTEAEALDVAGRLLLAWDEAIEREIDFSVPRGGRAHPQFELAPESEEEVVRGTAGEIVGRVVRRTGPLHGVLHLASEKLDEAMWKLHVDVENVTAHDDPTLEREHALRASFLGAHLLLQVQHGLFVSLLEPLGERAEAAAQGCENVRAFPVLVGRHGDRSTMLGSPIILYDWPAIAPESQGDFFDATEMDEMLTLRTLTLTDEEKREARATDPRAAALVERAEQITPHEMNQLHGAVRSLRVGRNDVAKGSRVRVRLGRRRHTDPQDMFVDGHVATVEDVREDFEGNGWIAVVVDDDPAAELNRWFGRHLWFHPDELELVEETS
ncbi:MAG: hypothetical protein JWM74_2914 [Myxococcaceae bacterium]|jgi:hypothetical protein|nr:hypothetical protein [Myxococcaceae bacterium]